MTSLFFTRILIGFSIVACVFAEARAADVELFNGKDLTGWKQAGPGSFDVKDGELHTVGGMGLLWYAQKQFADYTLSLEFKTFKASDNSGVFVRFPDPGNDPMKAVKEGEEIQINDGAKTLFTGGIYNVKNATELASKPPGEWNSMQITVVGPKITVKLNGKNVNEYSSAKPPPSGGGFLGLQNHDPNSKVTFRNVKVTTLPPATSQAATKPALTPVAIDQKRLPGVVGQYYKAVRNLKDLNPAATQPFYVRVDPNINFHSLSGQFYKSKLASHFAVTWTGYLRVTEPGEYTLQLSSDDDSTLHLGGHAMEAPQAKVTLASGDYPIKIAFHQINGRAGCRLLWKKPSYKPEQEPTAISRENLFHDAAQAQVAWNKEAWEKTTWSRKTWAKEYGDKYDKMDYGPFVSATIDFRNGNHANKGIAIRLGKDDAATICFDTDLLRWAAGWTGGFLDNHGVAFDGAHGVNPGPDGELLFSAPSLPGAMLGDTSEKLFRDPRPKPYGPLPREWAKYKGLQLHGDRVLLHYTVGDVDVLESPSVQTVGDEVVITRTIKLSPSEQPLTMLLDKPDPQRPVFIKTSGEAQVKPLGDLRCLVFAPRKKPATYQVALSRVDVAVTFASDDLDALAKPGTARWSPPIETKGVVSAATTQPYVVDTLTAPEENPHDAWLRFGGLDFFANGRAAVCTLSGDAWIVAGIDDKLEKLMWKRFASGLFQPLGLRIIDDKIYVLGRDQITRLHDDNSDGEADRYENFNNDCQVSRSFHEFGFDLQTDPQGNFYFAKAGPLRAGGRGWGELTDHNGCILRVSKDGGKLDVFATGVGVPNGIGVGPGGEVSVGDNDGSWAPACRINFVNRGDFLGAGALSKSDSPPKEHAKPICWLPHHEVDNSAGGQVWAPPSAWGPFAGRLLHTSYGRCALFLVMTETLDGQTQGGVVQFPKLDFISGICRPRFNPKDGHLYVAGLRGWQTTATRDCGLQRVRYTGAAVKMPTALNVTHDRVRVTFTTELDPSVATDATSYAVEQWNYKWPADGDAAEFSTTQPTNKSRDAVPVQSVALSPDKKAVTLKIQGVGPVMQMKIQMRLKAADGTPMDYVIYNTIHKVPKPPAIAPATTRAALNL